MAFPDDNLKQDGVYWAPTAPDSFGKAGFASPVKIKCRWEDAKAEGISIAGSDQIYSAKVFVNRDVETGGVIWLGKLADADSTPLANAGAATVARFRKIPTLQATAYQRVAYL